MHTRTIPIDIVPGGEPPVINVSQYDKGSRIFDFVLFSSDGEFEIPSGATASISGLKPDGNGFDYTATLEGNTVTVEITEQMTAVAGRVPCKIEIEKNGTKILTEKFILKVDRAALDIDALSSESEVRQLYEIRENMQEIIGAAASAQAAQEAAEAAQTATSESAQAAARSAQAAAESAQAAAQAKTAIDEADLDSKLESIDTAASNGVTAVNNARENAVGVVDSKAQEVAGLKVNAEAVATQALSKANNLENSFAEVESKTNILQQAVTQMQMLLSQKADNGYADSQGYLHLTSNGDDISGGIGPFATNGGGSGGGGGTQINAVFTARNASGWISKTIATGDECRIAIEWSSIEEEMETGSGTLKIYTGSMASVPKATLEVPQGLVSVDLASLKGCLSVGDNLVIVTIADIYGQNTRFSMSVSVTETYMTSPFDATQRQEGPFIFPVVPVGAVSKTIYCLVDDQVIDTITTSVSGRQITFTIPQQTHGAHSIRCYFECTINNQTVRSNELYFEFIAVEPLNNTPIITSSFKRATAAQYEMLAVDYLVFTAASETAEVELIKDSAVVSELTVDRAQQSWALRFDTAGAHTFAVRCGTVTKSFSITVTETEIDVEAETDQLALHLNAVGRSNLEADPTAWSSGAIAATLTGFNFVRDGWLTGDDGEFLRVSGDARVTVPYQIFGTDFRATGKTIEIEMATRNVLDYNATVLSCMSGGRGLQLTAQRAELKSEQSEIFTQYKEDEHIRISFVVEKRSENRLVHVYVNGIASGVIQYPTDDDFSQQEPVGISIGSNSCTIDIYRIRVYDNDLTRYQVLDNWIADTQDGALMLERYTRNKVFDEYGNVVISKLPVDLPYMVIECDELPQYKGDKKTVSGYYTDLAFPAKSFTFTACQANVQGTSSAPYPRKNYDLQFKGGFEMHGSDHADKYALGDKIIPFNRFVLKADVASSESANNTGLTMLYNEACPYKVPEMLGDDRVRWGIYGFPIVLFWHDTVSDTVKFYGKYNFNLPKRFPAGMGYVAP